MRLDDRAEIESALAMTLWKSYESARRSYSNLIRPVDRSANNLRRALSKDAFEDLVVELQFETYRDIRVCIFFLGFVYADLYFSIEIKCCSIHFLISR